MKNVGLIGFVVLVVACSSESSTRVLLVDQDSGPGDGSVGGDPPYGLGEACDADSHCGTLTAFIAKNFEPTNVPEAPRVGCIADAIGAKACGFVCWSTIQPRHEKYRLICEGLSGMCAAATSPNVANCYR